MENVRAVALTILNDRVTLERYSNLALDTLLRRTSFEDADRRLLTALVYGTIEKMLTLDHWIEVIAQRPIGEVDLSVRNLLRLGLYQLAFLDRVPDHAAVFETVAVASKKSKSFVNAVLREFVRRGKQIPLPPRSDLAVYLSVKYSFAPSICRAFLSAFGEERTESLLAAFCKQPPMDLRVNTLLTTREALLEKLRAQGIDAALTAQSPVGISISSAPVTSLPGFDEGLFFVQDEASQLCVEALDAKEGMTLLDVCACPGSKSFGAAINMKNRGRVLSCDLHGNKLSLVQSGARRLGISNIGTFIRDARNFNPDWEGIADRVLCDVPCSGFGVFAKKPELRYKDFEACRRLPEIQRAILENACRYVKSGGLLVYSTCTLLPAENRENVDAFLAAHPEFSCLQERTLYPDTDGSDGFFFAVLKKQ